jgi:Effector Associated Constant Component 1
MELQIEASADDLRDLRRMLEDELGDKADVLPLSSIAPGELREPLLIGLVVALGGPLVVESAATIISRWMEHRENMKDKELARLKLLVDGRSKQISVNELKAMAKVAK